MADAVNKEGALNMGDWHTCDTTHCRAGWVTHLAGDAGEELEDTMGTAMAAKMIYAKSSKIPVYLMEFYVSNEEAMESIKKCAKLERETNLTN